MRAVTMAEARRDVETLFRQVVEDCEPTIVLSETGEQVVVCPLDDYRSSSETAHLHRSPANAAHLRQSVAECRAGIYEQHDLDTQGPSASLRQPGPTTRGSKNTTVSSWSGSTS